MTRRTDLTVSVVIPAYNSSFLEETLDTVYAQTVSPSEVIVVNDGSSDETESRLRRLADDLPPSFIWRTKENGGEASARNLGLQLSTGAYIAFLDHDDLWHPEKLERQLHHFVSDADLALSFTGYEYKYSAFDESDDPDVLPTATHFEDWDPDPDFLLERFVFREIPLGPMSSVMVKRRALARVTPFDERLRIASDGLMFLELLIRRMKMDYLPDKLVTYRWHGSNQSSNTYGWEYGCMMWDTFWDAHASILPRHLRARGRRVRARCHLQCAVDAVLHGEQPRARRHIMRAARIRPRSVRPGWIRLLGIRPPTVDSRRIRPPRCWLD